MTSQINKTSLRKSFRQQRRRLSDSQQQQSALAICNQLEELSFTNTTFAAYLANDGEPSLLPFIELSWQHNKQVVLPVLHPFSKGYVLFQDYRPYTAMITNRFGITEPALNCANIAILNEIDVVLMPLVAFDKHKNRLGMGGGFYDRTLASACKLTKRPKFIGIAHNNQCYNGSLPKESWDIVLDHVVTPDYIL